MCDYHSFMDMHFISTVAERMRRMYRHRESFNAFAERRLREYLEENDRRIRSFIGRESENYVLNVNETEYIDYLVNEFTVDIPDIDFENVFISNNKKQIPAEQFPFGFNVRRGESYPKQVIVYHLPYTGNTDLLRCSPSQRILWTTKVFLEDQSLCFEIVNFGYNAEEIKREAQSIIRDLKTQWNYLTQEIRSYNTKLRPKIEIAFKARKQGFLDNNQTLASLGVPIKKREDLPQTYAIPTSQARKSIITRPIATTSEFKPEPALDQSIYHEILQTIHDVGKVFERYPSTYSSKKEEDLRDHLLLYLEPRYEGSATGETFNKTGKTDILIRYQNSNVFIAECKFWQGQKHYLDAITQLLGYLTWRDSKAAVVIFVRNKEFSSVLQIAEEVTPSHSNYLGFVNKEDESWFNYRFHINGDPNREVKLAILLFHIPS